MLSGLAVALLVALSALLLEGCGKHEDQAISAGFPTEAPGPAPTPSPTTTAAHAKDRAPSPASPEGPRVPTPIVAGDDVYLLVPATGKYLDVQGEQVQARYQEQSVWQSFEVETNSGGVVQSGDTIYLKAHTGRYIEVEGSAVQARPNIGHEFQALVIEKVSGSGEIWAADEVTLRAYTGRYISVQFNAVQAWSRNADGSSFIIEKFGVHRTTSNSVATSTTIQSGQVSTAQPSQVAGSTIAAGGGRTSVATSAGSTSTAPEGGSTSAATSAGSTTAATSADSTSVAPEGGKAPRAGSTSPAPSVATTEPSTWTGPKFRKYEPVRNCYLAAPLKEGFGCRLLASLQGPTFALNGHGQETTGRRNCLAKLRDLGGDSFVSEAGACEVWTCGSGDALRASAAPDADAPLLDWITLQADNGKYLIVDQDSLLQASGADDNDMATRFTVRRNSDDTVSLQDSQGKFTSVQPDGGVAVDRDAADLWEEFTLVENADGTVSWRSYHNTYLTTPIEGGALSATATAISSAQEFRMVTHAAVPYVVSNMSAGAHVYSKHCQYEAPTGGKLGQSIRAPVYVKLWEWNFGDIARECEEFLGPNGFDAVQVSPVAEHVLGSEWWTKYQPVSYGLNSRSGSAEELRDMVARCRAAGVQVAVDLVINHIGSPCDEARSIGDSPETPCRGWNGSMFGNRRWAGARGWDAATPELFHHEDYSEMQNCGISPPSYLCGSPDIRDCSCCPCDMYGLPDWNTGLQQVREKHYRHVEELHDMGVTMLRIDAALYESAEDLASVLNLFPWDFVYQEWWGEYPIPERTQYVGNMRDVALTWKITHALASEPDLSRFPQLLKLDHGTFGITPEDSIYPIAYHDGRTNDADSAHATYKNGLEYHQAQKFLLAWPETVKVIIWGGYSWADTKQGPPGCEAGESTCSPKPVYDASGPVACMPTPTESPLPPDQVYSHRWVCEHRWEGIAGLVAFRKACRGRPVAQVNDTAGAGHGHLAFRIGDACFVAMVRGHNRDKPHSWSPLGDWQLPGLETGLPAGRYCDVASLSTMQGWDRQSCPREVTVGEDGKVLAGTALQGDLLAIYTGAKLPDNPVRRLRTPASA